MGRAVIFISILIIHCTGVGRAGPDIMSKNDAEIDISLSIFYKSVFCGYNPADSFVLQDFGSSKEHRSGKTERSGQALFNSDNDFYYKREVKRCMNAIYAFPCPDGGKNSLYSRTDFLSRIAGARSSYCQFESVYFWNRVNQNVEGKFY